MSEQTFYLYSKLTYVYTQVGTQAGRIRALTGCDGKQMKVGWLVGQKKMYHVQPNDKMTIATTSQAFGLQFLIMTTHFELVHACVMISIYLSI